MRSSLEKRVAALEQQVALLQQQQPAPTDRAWLNDFYGKFAGDPIFAKAMKLGQQYRQSLRPRARRAKRK